MNRTIEQMQLSFRQLFASRSLNLGKFAVTGALPRVIGNKRNCLILRERGNICYCFQGSRENFDKISSVLSGDI